MVNIGLVVIAVAVLLSVLGLGLQDQISSGIKGMIGGNSTQQVASSAGATAGRALSEPVTLPPWFIILLLILVFIAK